MSNKLDRLKAAHENFERVQDALTKFGAGDSEPDHAYQWEIRNAMAGVPFKPLTAGQWQLYTCGMKCDGAAKRLNAALVKVVNIISTVTIAERPAVMAWLKEWAWRVDWEQEPSTVGEGH